MMKKLKLSRSKNHDDAKQQKISNFFNLKTELNIRVSQDKCEDKQHSAKVTVVNKEGKPPARNLCENCLQLSPKHESKFCNNCNLSHKVSNFTPVFNTKETNPLKKNYRECEFKPVKENFLSLCDSPDVIPPTPPALTKDLSKEKLGIKRCVKRKFNFVEKDCDKKRLLTSEQRQPKKKEKSKICADDPNDENIPLEEEKIFHAPSKNPFRKPSTKLTNDSKRSQATESLLESVLAELDKPVECLVESSLHNKSDVLSQKEECKSKSTVESVDLTYEENLQNHSKGGMSPHIEASFKALEDECDGDARVKTVDHFSKNLRSNLVSYSDDKLLIEKLSLEKKNLLVSTLSCSTSYSRKNSKHSYLQDKISDKIDLPPIGTLAEQIKERPNVSDDEDISTSFLDDLSFDGSTFKEPVNLEDGVRCQVLSVERLDSCGEVVLSLKPCDSINEKESAICVLRGSWTNTDASEGDTVSVWAKPEGQAGCWAVDNESGLLVTHPDLLVSGTTVVGSLFCLRRAVLSDVYRGMDSESSVMSIGCFLHELLQTVLKKQLTSPEEIKKAVDDFTSSRKFVFTLYASKTPLDETKTTLSEFIPKIHAFVTKYISSHKSYASGTKDWNHKDSWNGTITDVADIEENIWAPRLGVKGKVDVTVKTSMRHKQAVRDFKTLSKGL